MPLVAHTYRVDSIHCAGCEAAIRQALGSIDGIVDAQPDHRTNEVRVRFDERKTSPEAVVAALGNAGFPVRSAEPSADRGDEGADRQQPAPASERAARVPGENEGDDPSGLRRYAVLVVAVGVVALAGYLGYVLYPRFDLPAAHGAGLLALAAAAGLASFFSPCSFPLLLALLGRQAAVQANRAEVRPAVFGGALAAGAGLFLLLAGVVVALGGQALFAGVTFTSPAGITIRSIVGILLVLLGLIQTGILPFSLHGVSGLARPLARWQARVRLERPVAGFGVFGFAYVLAGFG